MKAGTGSAAASGLAGLSPRARLVGRIARPFLVQFAGASGRLVRLENDELARRGVLKVGRHVYGRPRILVWRTRDGRALHGCGVRIGNFVSFAPDVEVLTGGEHRTDWVTTYPLRIIFDLPGADEDGHPASRGDVTIGNDVWIGSGARIMSGSTIGDGAVVGSGAVVTGVVRPYAVVVGVPARELRRRFPDAHVEALLSIRWWDWPDATIADRANDLCSPDVSEFVRKYAVDAVASVRQA